MIVGRFFAWQTLRGIGEGVLGLVYPRNCAGCEQPLGPDGERLICRACEAKLHPIVPPICAVCGQTYEGEMAPGFRCGNCSDLDIAFDFAVGAFRNEGFARELIHRFKYEREHYLCSLLGRMLAEVFEEERLSASVSAGEEWLVVPVPLHPKRMREREYNQAAELSRVLKREARSQGIELSLSNALRRTRYTRRQASLDRADRLKNLKGAFRMKRRARVENRSVLLVDDVLTTGATASECARVLIDEGGADTVVVITVVRG